jgi:hypothetical protein
MSQRKAAKALGVGRRTIRDDLGGRKAPAPAAVVDADDDGGAFSLEVMPSCSGPRM